MKHTRSDIVFDVINYALVTLFLLAVAYPLYFIIIASSLFVFSDLLIGNARYGVIRIDIYFLIDITYVLNILLMSHVQLFLNLKKE